jgi:hypothetical protein
MGFQPVSRNCAGKTPMARVHASSPVKLEIQKLRDDYLAWHGGTLRDFHDAFVKTGRLPLPLVRKILLDDSRR